MVAHARRSSDRRRVLAGASGGAQPAVGGRAAPATAAGRGGRLQVAPPQAPVIVAGVTGADAAAAELIERCRAAERSAGAARTRRRTRRRKLGRASAHPEHPQFGFKKLIDGLGLSRADVQPSAHSGARRPERARWSLACEAMRPAATTERLASFLAGADKREMAAALTGMSLVEAATAEEEAEAIALMLRESRGDAAAGRRSSSRPIARWRAGWRRGWRYGASTSRMSGGAAVRQDHSRHVPGSGGRGGGEAIRAGGADDIAQASAVPAGMAPRSWRRGGARWSWPASARPISARAWRAWRRHWRIRANESWRHAASDGSRTPTGSRPRFAEAPGCRFRAHREVRLGEAVPACTNWRHCTSQPLRHWPRRPTRDDGSALRQGEAGEWAAQFFASLIDKTMPAPAMAGGRLPRFLPHAGGREEHPPAPSHGIRASRSATRSRRACSRPMSSSSARSTRAPGPRPPIRGRGSAGRCGRRWAWPRRRSASARRRTTSSSQLGAQRVVLTRAAKVDGVPTVPSRWLLRLQALVKGLDWRSERSSPGSPGRRRAQSRSRQAARARARAPPARGSSRPRELSVTTDRDLDRQSLRHLRRAHPGPRGVAAARAGGRTRRCAARSCTRRSVASPSAIRASCRKDIAEELMDHREGGAGRLHRQPAGGRVLGAAARPLRRLVCRDGRRPARRHQRGRCRGRGQDGAAGPAGPFTLKARADRIDMGDGRSHHHRLQEGAKPAAI